MAARLTTTSYCLLGVLRLQPSSAYDLTKYMQRSALASIWPRTEAAIYRETRRLADAGLATSTTEQDGRRSRSVYRITAEGRTVLADWLHQPAAGLSFECEAAVKAFFADAGNGDALSAHLEGLVEGFEVDAARMEVLTSAWLEGDLRFPDRIHYTAMAADLISRVQVAARDWAEEWQDRTDAWDGTAIDESKRAEAQEVIETLRQQAHDRPRVGTAP